MKEREGKTSSVSVVSHILCGVCDVLKRETQQHIGEERHFHLSRKTLASVTFICSLS